MTKKQKNKNWVSWILMIVLFVVAAAIVYLVWDAYFREKDISDNDDVNKDGSAVIEEGAKDNSTTEKNEQESEERELSVVEAEENEKDIPGYDGDDANTSLELTGAVTYADVIDDQLIIRVNIDQFLAEGNCELKLLKENELVYNDTARITNSAATATCEGFNVPITDVMNDYLMIQIQLSSGDKNGLINGEVNI